MTYLKNLHSTIQSNGQYTREVKMRVQAGQFVTEGKQQERKGRFTRR